MSTPGLRKIQTSRLSLLIGILGIQLFWGYSFAPAAIPLAEREALIALYYNTNGASWRDNKNWLGEMGTECTWSGITCDAAQTTVVEIDLTANNLIPG
ncbi:hypothetical protein ACFL27_07500 [candidate division CSSED10-310 bacterium]|uniref:Leucine-rich repeat-containing N-terminal plant-type domain-containing protein n=1 Tax=candidate division CSSED10-310 bacterium TaxID=2855610 RepID=A0ABV6YV26_UNCC1